MSNHPTVIYRVKKGFMYGGKAYRPGDEWKPGKGRFDQKIIDGGIYINVEHREVSGLVDANKRKIRQGKMSSRALASFAYEQYEEEKKSFTQIAEECGVAVSTISRAYKREKERRKEEGENG